MDRWDSRWWAMTASGRGERRTRCASSTRPRRTTSLCCGGASNGEGGSSGSARLRQHLGAVLRLHFLSNLRGAELAVDELLEKALHVDAARSLVAGALAQAQPAAADAAEFLRLNRGRRREIDQRLRHGNGPFGRRGDVAGSRRGPRRGAGGGCRRGSLGAPATATRRKRRDDHDGAERDGREHRPSPWAARERPSLLQTM